jgi:BirA family biotin operon repressor/biotin-[acetyl-CoA-carboxylase] ligase
VSFDAPRFDRLLSAGFPDHQLGRPSAGWASVQHLSSTDSTQSQLRLDFAHRAEVAGRWRVVVADAQTAGRGRTGAAWQSLAGAGLWFTVGAVLPVQPWWLPRASLVAGQAVAEVLAAAGLPVALKWPNDVMAVVNARWTKLAGILCERVSGGCGDGVWLCGVGLNVARTPPGLEGAGCLASLGWQGDTTELAAALCVRIRDAVEAWVVRGGQIDAWRIEHFLAFRGCRVELDFGPLQGRRRVQLEGLDVTGALRVRTSEGRLEVCTPLALTAAESTPAWRADPDSV